MTKQAKNVEMIDDNLAQLQEKRQNPRFWWSRKHKRKLDQEIMYAETDYRIARHRFEEVYRIKPEDFSLKLEKIQRRIQYNKSEIEKKNKLIPEFAEKIEVARQEYIKQELMFKKKAKKQPEPALEQDPITGRLVTIPLLHELRQSANREKRTKERRKRIGAIKPHKILMIESPEQKIRKLADVIGQRDYEISGAKRPITTPKGARKRMYEQRR